MVELDEATILLITCVVVVFGTPILLKAYAIVKGLIEAQGQAEEERAQGGKGKRKKPIIDDEWDFETELAEELGLKQDEEEAEDPRARRKRERKKRRDDAKG